MRWREIGARCSTATSGCRPNPLLPRARVRVRVRVRLRLRLRLHCYLGLQGLSGLPPVERLSMGALLWQLLRQLLAAREGLS